jgi:hypothetical protein
MIGIAIRRAMLFVLALSAVSIAAPQPEGESLLDKISRAHRLNAAQSEALRAVFAHSPYIGQGNPAIARHLMTPTECRAKQQSVPYDAAAFDRICGAPNMAPLFAPARQRVEDARACIDQFEFPDIRCEYPVVWVRANEAAQICSAIGKRLCDAHEWEGACQGSVESPDYRFDLARGPSMGAAVEHMRAEHNRQYAGTARHSYGPVYQRGICATGGGKSPGCDGGGWNRCGSNTFPTGAFADCHSPLWVYDLEGNAAEHMNLPLAPEQMASLGSRQLGVTEMKGSWFVFDTYHAHEDWCRWRAPFWHGSRVLDPASHANYHLGFRCCKDVGEGEPRR